MELKQFISKLNKFTPEQRSEIESYLKSLKIQSFDSIRSEIVKSKLCCPDCSSEHVKKNGHYGNKQKYVCKACNKGFNVLTGTCIHRIHKKNVWSQFVELTLESKSIRKISEKLNLSNQTVLDWRHKLLVSLNDTFTKEFHGIVEMDDMLMRLNQKGRRKGTFIEKSRRTVSYINQYGNRISKKIKGNRKRGISNDQVSVLVIMDRYGTIGTSMLKRGKMDSKNLKRALNDGLLNRLNKGNTIVTDEAKAYVSVLKKSGFDHEHINAGRKEWSKGIYHLNTLNNADGRFKQWIRGNFGSVSTKYLNNYLGYFKMLFFVLSKQNDNTEKLLEYSLVSNASWDRKKEIENQYKKLLKY